MNNDAPKKVQDNGIHVRCTKCKKLLAKRSFPENLEIKCSRCGAIEVIFKKST
jgi:phage FluMu protein Com